MKTFRGFPIWLLITGFFLVVSGCRVAEAPVVIMSVPSSSPEPRVTPSPQEISQDLATPSVVSSQTPNSDLQDRPQYSIAAILDYPNHHVDVKEVILIPHPVDNLLENVILVVPPNNWPGALTIKEISAKNIKVESFQISGVKLNIELSEPGWRPGEILELHISYSLDLPDLGDGANLGTSPFGYSPLQTNLVDWYPMVAPYQADLGWTIHEPWKFGEYLVYPAADFEVSLDTGTSGLTVAASSTPINTGEPMLYSLGNARNFVFSISSDYDVIEEVYDGIGVLGYSFPGYQVPGQAVFDATLEALQLYSALYGPYEQPSLSVVQGDFNYGMEYEGLYFQGKGYYDTYNGSEKSYLVTIAVHETAHQWWFGRVANDQALEPWLDEALCTFSELAYYEQLYPRSINWWWRTRVNYYAPSGRIDRSIYDFQGMDDPYLTYRDATYLQGAKFLAALKNELGDEQFYSLLIDYGTVYRDQIAREGDFFSVLGDYIDVSSLDWIGEYFPE